jgi:hypothetical protein
MNFSSPHAAVPPTLRRPLLLCALTLAAALLVWQLAATFLDNQQTRLNTAHTNLRALDTRLTAAREAQATRAALAQRLATLRTTLGDTRPEEAEGAQLTQRLTQDTRITRPVLHAHATSPAQPAQPSPGLPSLDIQRLQIDTGLLHEEALLAFTRLVTESAAHIIPIGCALHRQEAEDGDNELAPLRARCEFERITLAAQTGTPQ